MHFTDSVLARFAAFVLAFVGLASLAAACTDDATAGQPDVEVRMLDNTYVFEANGGAESGTMEAGQSIGFVNNGRVPHNIIAVDGSFNSVLDTGGDQDPGERWLWTIDEPGEYVFFCDLHAIETADGDYTGMVGTVTVTDAQSADDSTNTGGATTDGTATEDTATDSTATDGEASTLPGSSSDSPDAWTGETRSVPQDYPTIQSAVDATEPGDLVLVAPGVYKEAVAVTTPGITIRGEDRNTVILDGEFTRENGVAVTADGVAVENMTARNYTVNGFFWDGVTGYRGSYLTAIDDWVYGIYAFDSKDGLFEHSYASGAWDAGFYIGQCDPCDAVITDVVAEYNGFGYSGSNASNNLYLVNSEWRNNVTGIIPNSIDSELLPPTKGVVMAGNYIHHNGGNELAPSGSLEWIGGGNGILLAGVRDSLVRDNLVVNNHNSGIQVMSMIDDNLWRSGGNEVRNNKVMGSGRVDLALGGPFEQGSCFADNDASTTSPTLLRQLHSCDGFNRPLWWGMAATSEALARIAQVTFEQKPQLEHGEAPKPELTFAQIPGGSEAPVRPAVDVMASLDFDPSAITMPELPEGIEIDGRRPVVFGIPIDGGFWPLVMGALFWWIPLFTWVIGVLWALYRIVTTPGRSGLTKALWAVAVLLLPFLGALAYFLIAHRIVDGKGNKASDDNDDRDGAAVGAGLRRVGWRRSLLQGFVAPFAWLVITIVALVVGGVV